MIYLMLFFTVLLLLLIISYRYKCFYKNKGYSRWSVGISRINDFGEISVNADVVISHHFVNDISKMDFIADPFLIKKENDYYLFVEAAKNEFGRIDVYKSVDLKKWEFSGVAMSEDFHLSYPQVFRHNGKDYMIPETKHAGEVALYEPVEFPLKWQKRRVLLKGRFVDTTIFFHNGNVYLFGYEAGVLKCYFTEDLLSGDFKEHPSSPLGVGNKMRPAGTIFIKNNKIVLPVQSRSKGYGYAVYSVVIKELTPLKMDYSKGGALLKPNKKSEFFKEGVHTLSVIKDENSYVVAIDGRTGIKKAYWRNDCRKTIDDMKNSIRSSIIIFKNKMRN